ncbi:MAG: hypothetical protein RR712_01265 [Terrisporobacter sp.]|uniref:hypothetical protein n=1 Tax=Terrisporobacter sp. TaxID=1965305 RepID=UPI002FC8276A
MGKKAIILVLLLSSIFSVGCIKQENMEDLINVLENKEDLFEGDNLSKKIVEKGRKTGGDYSIFQPHTSSQEDGEISRAFPDSFVDVFEFKLKENKNYKIELYSEYYEKDSLQKTEILFDDVISAEKDMYIINDSRHDASKRELLLHFTNKDKILKSVEYYLPANWNQYGFLFNDTFNDGESIPLIVYERGVKGKDGKYKTASCNLTLEGDKREKSIQKAMRKNAQTVIIKMKVNEE